MHILDGIWQVGGDGVSAPGDGAVYLVRFGQEAALIDAGCGSGHERVIANISGCIGSDSPVSRIFLTHCHFDHTGGAGSLQKHYGAAVVAHEHDAVFIESGDDRVTAAQWYNASASPLTVDHKITGPRETFRVGQGILESLHCPGHSPGSVVYITRAEGLTVLFGQDIHGPLHPDLLSNRDDYLNSLSVLADLGADILCEGHFGVIRGRDEVRDFIVSYMK